MSGLGKYSNDPSKAAEEETAKRRAVVHKVGDYLLTLHEKWQIYDVSRKDGKPVPQALSGRWTTVSTFRDAVAKHDSMGGGSGQSSNSPQ